RSRKEVLVAYGFRLPSALDNRPLSFEEWEQRIKQVVYVSATPGPYELAKSQGVVVEQIIRPTGLIDPPIEVRPVKGQVDDLPEVSLVAILDADKEGFLRSAGSLIQTSGRAARNVNGRVIMYADQVTASMQGAIGETQRRRAVQEAFNIEHNITPQSIVRAIDEVMSSVYERDYLTPAATL